MDEVVRSEMDDRVPAEISMEGNGTSFISDGDLQQIDSRQEQFFGARTLMWKSSKCSWKHTFVQIDGTLNKLSTLREYVDDTEDYINIMLDDKQNHLLQMGVMLTTATLVVSAFVVVAGVFGMNIHIELFDETKAGMPEFLWTVGGGTAGTVFLYVIAIAWCKHRRLLE
ncbi:Magnesium transporter MRS2-3 [Abeliophyllum distichum]|uniref:Magnesium transporter MRS2-3 n=1 Tax=Abeliophyllum distichum TaxID=126358 RepID=A0ABD1V842_9LAMI